MVNSADATNKGWMPEATKVAVPASNFRVGCTTRRAVVLHIGEGSVSAILGEFTPEGKEKSAHFVVSKTGAIWQCVSILDTAYANGLTYKKGHWVDPEGNTVTPSWQGLTPPTNPNLYTISIEREGHYQDIPPAAQDAAVVRILQYVHGLFPTLLPTWFFMGTLIGHRHISPIARANCPGPHCDYPALAAAANGTIRPVPPPITRYQLVAPCIPFTARNPSAPLAAGVVFQPGDIVQVGNVQDGWLWVSDKETTAPGIGFLPSSYARPV